MSNESRISDGSRARITQNRHRVGIEQTAAADLEAARRARAAGEPIDYVPLWQR